MSKIEAEIIGEHSGCGQGVQVDNMTVRLASGDKLYVVRGKIGQALMPATRRVETFYTATPTEQGEDDLVDQLARQAAVTAVDSIHGYTMEFNQNPAQHRAEYDRAESALRYELRRVIVPEISALRARVAELEARATPQADPFEHCAKEAEAQAELVEQMRGVYPGDPTGALGRDANKMRKLAKAIRTLSNQGSSSNGQ